MQLPDTSRSATGQWLPGVSGNPLGRPPGTGSITVELRRQLLQTDECGIPLHARIAERLLAMAVEGDLRAIREVLDRIEGTSVAAKPEADEPIQLAPITLERPT